ncbi:uncharacterized protein J3D65DRAFT_605966 [Phyllosticta citribraziliensis]|uniref:Uncharacterized protein n=1 Tax=Phyllosticta citribraziliensis TaxID=989973 RepID=A0ABR1L9R1_9PEZI
MSSSDDSSTTQQRENGQLINVARGRAPNFIDALLPEGVEPPAANTQAPSARASVASDASDMSSNSDADLPAQIAWANGNFMDVMGETIDALPLAITAGPHGNSALLALINIIAARRVLPDAPGGDDAISRFFTSILGYISPRFHNQAVGRGVPDRVVNVYALANRVFNEAHEQVTARNRSLDDGNPFQSQDGLRLLRIDLLAHAHSHIRRAARTAQTPNDHAFWLNVQGYVLLLTNELDDDEARRFFAVV